jgi:hypothetical protein
MNTKYKWVMHQAIIATIRTVAAGALFVLAAGTLSLPALAEDHSSPCHAAADEMKVPETAQEHIDRASQYRRKAADYRQEVEAHRRMLAEYSKGVPTNLKGPENPYIKRMRLHCAKYIKAAEDLTLDAEEMAKFHEMRAKEMEGN